MIYLPGDICLMDMLVKIEKAKKENWKICIYGLGLIGSNFGDECLSYFDLKPDFYCDANTEVLDNWNAPADKKIVKEKLIKSETDFLVLMFVSEARYDNIYSDFMNNSRLHIITWNDIQKCEKVICCYFNLNSLPNEIERKKIDAVEKKEIDPNKKVAVFTCITGGYDNLNKPLVINKQCDYFLITDVPNDVKIENEEYYTRIPISQVVPDNLTTPKAQNRYCKAHGFEVFENYDYSIYVDGNIQIIGNMIDLLKKIGKYGVAFHRFTYGEDVYEHAMSLAIRSRINREDACQEMQKLAKKGFPRNYGFPEGGVVICDHHCEDGKRILTEWNDYYNGALAKRDQLYLPYVLWKNGIETDEVCTLPGNLRTNGYFKITNGHTGFQP